MKSRSGSRVGDSGSFLDMIFYDNFCPDRNRRFLTNPPDQNGMGWGGMGRNEWMGWMGWMGWTGWDGWMLFLTGSLSESEKVQAN